MLLMMVSVPSFYSCNSDDDSTNNAISEYTGTWKCTHPATYLTSTIVEKGTTLLITQSGNMTWTMSDGTTYNATMRALGDDWADITYKNKTYRAEIYVRFNSLTINANCDAKLIRKDFPFDGNYQEVK